MNSKSVRNMQSFISKESYKQCTLLATVIRIVHYRVHKSPPLVPTLSLHQTRPNSHSFCFYKVQVNGVLRPRPSKKSSFTCPTHQNPVLCVFLLPHAIHMTCPSHFLFFFLRLTSQSARNRQTINLYLLSTTNSTNIVPTV